MNPGQSLGRRASMVTSGFVLVISLPLWAMWLTRSTWIVVAHTGHVPRSDAWLYDWNVYHAAAVDLLNRTLYRVPLVEPGHQLPIDFFNYPPLAAGLAVPFLPLPTEPGGIAWLVVGIVATSLGALIAGRAIGLSWAWSSLVAGAALVVYTGWAPFESHIVLGNNNHLLFALIAGFALAHRRERQRTAGVLLALAIGTKLWPVALLVVVLRERRWRELRWTGGVLAIQGLVAIAWLGPDVIGPMVPALVDQNVSRGIPSADLVIWTGWARAAWDWWPAWGGYAVAVALLLVPATGRLGLGLGIIAGLSLNTYLWHHYAPVFLFGAILILAGTLARLRRSISVDQPAVAIPLYRSEGKDTPPT